MADLVVAHTMGDLGLNLNFDYVKDVAGGIDGFIGVAGMARYKLNDSVAIAGRGEYASVVVPAGTGERLSLYEGTLGLAFPVANRFEFRAEGRGGLRQPGCLLDSDGNASSEQVTGTRRVPRLVLGLSHATNKTPHARVAHPAARAFLFSAAGVLSPLPTYVRRRMSLSTPAAVTAGPAPGPVMTSGFLR